MRMRSLVLLPFVVLPTWGAGIALPAVLRPALPPRTTGSC